MSPLDYAVIAWLILTQCVMIWKMVTDFRNPPRFSILLVFFVVSCLWAWRW